MTYSHNEPREYILELNLLAVYSKVLILIYVHILNVTNMNLLINTTIFVAGYYIYLGRELERLSKNCFPT